MEKWYDNRFHALRGVNLTVNKQEVVVIMGPSGSGKSTFIRTFNGLESYQKGRIIIDGITVSHNLKNHWSKEILPPSSQDCNLFDYFMWSEFEGDVSK